MSRDIVRSRQARMDVLGAADFISEFSLNASDRFLQATEKAYRTLAESPGIGVVRDYDNPKYTGMRMWPIPGFQKYLICYQTNEDEIVIMRVLNGARDLLSIFAPEDPAE